MLVGIMDYLAQHSPLVEEDIGNLFDSHNPIVFDNELDNAVACYLVIKRCAESDDDQIEITIARNYSHERNYNEILESFKDIFIEPFYDYLDENLDDKGLILSLLTQYKHKCEWFQRNKLYDAWNSDTKHGEKYLALHLYEYLHGQGVQFYIEPSSVSGQVDLVSSQVGDEPLVADAKIFNPSKSKGSGYIAKGYRQLYNYTVDYNEPFGFLIIYKTCEEDLKFTFKDQSQKTQFICHNNKTIFFVTIDIFPYEKSASKRGTLKYVELSESDLLRSLK